MYKLYYIFTIAVTCLLMLGTSALAEKVVIIPLGETTNIEASINWRGEWTSDTPYR